MRADAGERPGGVIVDIGRETQFGAAAHRACEKIEGFRIDEPALALAPFRPGIGIQEIDAREARLRQPVEHERRVASIEADILGACPLDRRQKLRDPVDEGLATDEPDSRFSGRGLDQVLAASKADLEPDFFDRRRKERAGVKRGREIEGEPGKQRVDELRLMAAQRLAFRAAVQAAMREGVGHRRRIAGELGRGKLRLPQQKGWR